MTGAGTGRCPPWKPFQIIFLMCLLRLFFMWAAQGSYVTYMCKTNTRLHMQRSVWGGKEEEWVGGKHGGHMWVFADSSTRYCVVEAGEFVNWGWGWGGEKQREVEAKCFLSVPNCGEYPSRVVSVSHIFKKKYMICIWFGTLYENDPPVIRKDHIPHDFCFRQGQETIRLGSCMGKRIRFRAPGPAVWT